jgi:hypothetical protein
LLKKICKDSKTVPGYTDSTVPCNSVYSHAGLEEQGQLLSECPNATIYKYTLTLKRRKEQNGCKNTIKLTATILTK